MCGGQTKACQVFNGTSKNAAIFLVFISQSVVINQSEDLFCLRVSLRLEFTS